jgi:hypothetical protein
MCASEITSRVPVRPRSYCFAETFGWEFFADSAAAINFKANASGEPNCLGSGLFLCASGVGGQFSPGRGQLLFLRLPVPEQREQVVTRTNQEPLRIN